MDTGVVIPGDSGTGPRDTGVTPPVDTGTGTDAFVPPRDSGRDTGSGRVCATSCSSDSQCSSTCPPVMSRASCCDLGTNTCYAATTSVCPRSADDAGMSMY